MLIVGNHYLFTYTKMLEDVFEDGVGVYFADDFGEVMDALAEVFAEEVGGQAAVEAAGDAADGAEGGAEGFVVALVGDDGLIVAQGVEVDAAGEGRFEGVDAGVGFGREGEDVAGVGAVAGEAGIDGTEGGAEGGGVEGVGLVEEDEELLVAAEGEEAGAEAVVLRGGL